MEYIILLRNAGLFPLPTLMIFLLLAAGAVLVWIMLKFSDVLPWGSRIRPASEDEQLILIAQFLHSDNVKDRDVAAILREDTQKAIEDLKLGDIRVEVDSTRLLADDIDNAQQLGNRYKASIIVWGTDTGSQITINMLNLRLANANDSRLTSRLARYNVDESTFIITPSVHNCFTTQHFFENLEFISYLTLGHIYDVENDYQEAIQVLAKAMASINVNLPPVEGLAKTYLRLGWIYHVPLDNPTISMRYYNQAIDLDPSYVDAYNNRGVLRLFSNDPTGALSDFDQSLKLNPKLIGALMSRGTLYNQLGQLELAIADYTAFLELAGDSVFNIAAYFGRGSALAKLENFDEAIDDFCKAMAKEPDDNIKAAILYSIANTLKNKALKNKHAGDTDTVEKDFKQAINDYEASIKLFSSSDDKANAYYEIGSIFDTMQNFDKSVKALDEAVKLFQDTKKMNEVINFRHQVVERKDQVQSS